MRIALWIGGLLLLAAVAGHHAVRFVRPWAAVAGKHVIEATPDSVTIETARQQLTAMDANIEQGAARLDELEFKAELASTTLKGQQKKLADNRAIQDQARLLLASHEQVYTVGTRAYSRQKVADDLAARERQAEHLDRLITTQSSLADRLHQAVADGRARLTEARETWVRRKADLDALEDRLAAARSQEETAVIIADLSNELDSEPESDLQSTFTELERRVRSYERRAEAHDGSSNRNEIVQWSQPAATDAPQIAGGQ